jgi:hypothetical protein
MLFRSIMWLLAVLVMCGIGLAQDKPSRTEDQIKSDLDTAHREFIQAVGNDPNIISDATKRAAVAPKAIPPLRRMIEDFDDLAQIHPDQKPRTTEVQQHFAAFLIVLGDQPTIDRIAGLAASTNVADSIHGKSSQLLAQWILATNDPAAQIKLVEQVQKMDTDHPESVELTSLTRTLAGSAATKDLTERLNSLAKAMNNPLANSLRGNTN